MKKGFKDIDVSTLYRLIQRVEENKKLRKKYKEQTRLKGIV